MVALFAGLAMVAGVLTVTQLASSALEEDNSGLGAGECQTTAPPAEEETAGAEDTEGTEDTEDTGAAEDAEGAESTEGDAEAVQDPEADDGVTSTNELEAHVEVEADGFEHVHYRRYGWHGWGRGRGPHHGPRPRPSASETAPPVDCEEPTGDPTEEPTEDPTADPTADPTEAPTGDPTGGPTEDPTEAPTEDPTEAPTEDPTEAPTEDPAGPPPLEIVGRTCAEVGAGLEIHTGFQAEGAQCVETQMGVVSAVQNNPSLLIADFPESVAVNEPFTITVSFRNLVRDRFLGAAAGGYYIESSFLDENGITRGHAHTGCVNLVEGDVAPSPDTLLNPQFFAALEDGGGGAGESRVEIQIPGLPDAGEYRCMVWAGDASHRPPMMSFARMQGPFDAVRINVG